ncbi:sodium:proton antiporter [Enterococcus sp. JM4C]|uniref:cation:proton antiporter n=1 Tax=Candidatus Enterococcus huntleyi TaxID=1857217 RepID=UPI00137B5D34|nr:sodium:proton antiporter [Enterococcus sp. JM4C]KAF1298168.1 sodium:proton antiporter [Enterococcus sp. JM4C]
MEFIELLIVFALAITFSNVVSRILPSVPLPLIQIGLGILIGMTEMGASITFEPEIFLIMIIAPLLFREGEEADIPSIMKNFGTILFLAFGGVILTLFGVGLTLSVLLPALPLAACFAFGAALGPTDAVAVMSLSGRINIPKKAMNILKGEGLLNDASGVTAFQFAVAALLTGSFSAFNATAILIVSSIGGALTGFVLVWIKRQVIQLIERAAARDVTGYLLIDLLLPFLAYVLAEHIGVSGIISAVVAGVLQSFGFRKITLFDAELSNVSESFWSTLVFTLNALVFLFLGIELSQVFSPIWASDLYPNSHLLLIVLVIATMLFVLRFTYISIFYLVKDGVAHFKGQLNEILLLTFGGVKGTVSLATAFILPLSLNGESFPERSLLLFLTACVILVTLIVGVIVLPWLASDEEEEIKEQKLIPILKEVIAELRLDIATKELTEKEHIAVEAVIENYQERLQDAYTDQLNDSEQQEVQELQALILAIEKEGLDTSFRDHKISPNGYRFYSRFITRFENTITRQILSFIGFWLIVGNRLIRIVLHPKMFWERKRQQGLRSPLNELDVAEVKEVYIQNTQLILESLNNLEDVYDAQLIEHFVDDRVESTNKLEQGTFFSTFMIQQDVLYEKELLRGYYLERKIIDEHEVAGEVSTYLANVYRQKVNLLESYSVNKIDESKPMRLTLKGRKLPVGEQQDK